MRIDGSLLQEHPHIRDGESGVAAVENAGKVERRPFGNVAREAQDNHRIAGDLRRLLAKTKQREEQQNEAEKDKEHPSDQPDDELDHSYSESSMGTKFQKGLIRTAELWRTHIKR